MPFCLLPSSLCQGVLPLSLLPGPQRLRVLLRLGLSSKLCCFCLGNFDSALLDLGR